MTPARKAALQWFHDRGEVGWPEYVGGLWFGAITDRLVALMKRDGQLSQEYVEHIGTRFSLTDKGRRDLHEAKP